MSETAFQATPPVPSALPTEEVKPPEPEPKPSPQGAGVGHVLWLCLKGLASPRLTVFLFVLSLVLVFTGTMAQIDSGILAVMTGYFRSFRVWIPWQLFVRFAQVFLVFLEVPKTTHVGGSFPFPGGLTLGAALLINLLAAHVVRFKVSWKRSGILILHAGLIVMILGEVVTGQLANESKMILMIGETVNFVDESSKVEIAFTDSSNPDKDVVTVIPGSILSKKGIVSDPSLPVDVEVVEYFKNSDLEKGRTVFLHQALKQAEAEKETANKAGRAAAEKKVAEAQAALEKAESWTRNSQMATPFTVFDRSEETGVDPNQREDAPSARVTLRDKKTEKVIGTFVVSLWFYSNFTQRLPVYRFPTEQFTVDGKTYSIEMRLKRHYKPYRIKLEQFHHDFYPGTDVPKDFSSDIRLSDPDREVDRDEKIFMNNPLRYSGETFYQSGWLAGDRGTILQVVRNPGDWMPYVSCFLVTAGMTIHFLLHLLSFVSRRLA